MRPLLLGAVVPAALCIAWEATWHLPSLRRESLSRPWDVAAALLRTLADGTLWTATHQTLEAALLGFMMAALLGVPGGLMLGLQPRLERIVGPSVDGLRPVPSVALIPLALMVFGFGVALEASVVAFACVWPVLIVTTGAVRQVPPGLLEVGRVLEMGAWQRVFRLVLPAALPGIAVGLRLALGIALIVAVTVEIVINPRGLGYALMASQQAMQFDAMYAQLLWTCLTGWALSTLSSRLIAACPGMPARAAQGVRA